MERQYIWEIINEESLSNWFNRKISHMNECFWLFYTFLVLLWTSTGNSEQCPLNILNTYIQRLTTYFPQSTFAPWLDISLFVCWKSTMVLKFSLGRKYYSRNLRGDAIFASIFFGSLSKSLWPQYIKACQIGYYCFWVDFRCIVL